MSSFHERCRSRSVSDDWRLSPEMEAFAAEFPSLAAALAGSAASGEEAAVAPFKLTLFIRDGRLRFSLGQDQGEFWAVGELSDPTKGLAGIDLAIAEDRLGWRREDSKKRR